jgi:dienelactone hydrolase
MKKLVALALAVGMTIGVTACGNPADSANGSTEESGKGSVVESVEDEVLGIKFESREMKTDGQLYTGGNVTYANELWQTPEVEYDSSLDCGNVKGIYITSPVTYNGKPTKIMGYIGFPSEATAQEKCPAIVLVHGGGGTAFPDWVKLWNDRGYAAIAIDTEGGQSSSATTMDNGSHVERNKYANDEVYTVGPSNNSQTNPGADGFWMPGGLENLKNSWMYHATSAVILANSLIRSDERVDTSLVGITGISWGSIITNIVVGYDDRYAFAMPVYGSVAVDGTAGWLSSYPSEESKQTWDTTEPMKLSTTPMLWVTGNRDEAFGLDAPSACYKVAQNGYMAIKPALTHGQRQGAEPGELLTFADAVTGRGNQIVKITKNPTKEDKTLALKIGTEVTLNSVKIYYVTDKYYKANSVWKTKTVGIDETTLSCNVEFPANATYAYVSVTYNNNLNVSTGLIEL